MDFRKKAGKQIAAPRRAEETGVEDFPVEVYERLWLLNQHCSSVAEILRFFEKKSVLSKKESTYYQLMVEEVRASSSQSIVESMDGREVEMAGIASKRLFTLEQKLCSAQNE